MMKYIIDASVIIAVIANEPEKNQLIKITKGADLLAPSSIHWEIGNAFSAMMKRGRISLEKAIKAIEIYRRIPIRFLEVELEDTLAIVSEFGVYAYDAYLLRCAKKYNGTLITLDKKLVEVAKEMGLEVVEVI